MGLTAGVLQLLLTLFDEVIPLFLGTFQRMLCIVLGLLGLGLCLLQLGLQIVQLGQHTVQPLVIVRHVIARGINDLLRIPSFALIRKAFDLPGTPMLNL